MLDIFFENFILEIMTNRYISLVEAKHIKSFQKVILVFRDMIITEVKSQ